MPTPRQCVYAILFSGILLLTSMRSGLAAEPAKLLPETTVAFAELQNVDELIGIVLEHSLRDKIESLDAVKKAFASKEFLDFKAGVGLFQVQLGKPWREAIADLTNGGVVVGVDAATEGLAVLVEAENEETLTKFVRTVVELAKAQGRQQGNSKAVKSGEHRGVQAYEIGEAKFAQLGTTLVITNKSELGKSIIDAHLDGREKSFADNERFSEARAARPDDAQLWAFVDVQALRDANVAEQLYQGKADNPGVELLAGGILSILQKTPYATMALEVAPQRLAATIQTPNDPAWNPEERHYYFGPEGKGRAPETLPVENQIFTLATYRDISQMWLRAGDLFDENTNDGLAQVDSTLSTLFSGKDFGEDILGALHPELQLIVTRQDFENVLPAPSIRLPSFAIAARLRDPETMQRELRRIFQSLIGFLNVTGAMNDQPQLDLDQERDGDSLIVWAQYAPEEDEKESTKARINFNFSPAVAFHEDRIIFSSTRALANELLKAPAKPAAGGADNTRAQLDFKELRMALAANQEHLIAQNMLEEGSSREEAETQINILLSLLRFVDGAAVRLTPSEGDLQLSAEIRLVEDPESD